MKPQEHKRLKRRVRNSYLVSTVSIAMVLFLLGSVAYLILNALGATDRMRESLAVHVMLKSGLEQESIAEIGDRLAQQEAVLDVVFISKEEAAEDFIDFIGTDFVDFLDFNPLPDSYQVRFKAENTSKTNLEEFERRVLTWPQVHEVVYQKNVAEHIGSDKVTLVLLMFGACLLIISLILLNNTIRITIFSKRYVISTMKLVGATKWFVMKPFLKTSVMQGIYSALIATALFIGMVAGLREGLPELGFTNDNIILIAIVGGMFLVGILISLLFTIFAVNKFVKMHNDAVNFY